MNIRKATCYPALTLTLFLMLTACGGGAGDATPTGEAPAQAGAAQDQSTEKAEISVDADAPSPKAEAFAAGSGVLLPLVIAKQESFAPVKLDNIGRFDIHPGRSEASWAEFNVGAIKGLDLYPAIHKLSPACAEKPQAATVRLTVLVDGVRVGEPIAVNRATHSRLGLVFDGAKVLRLEVDNADGSVSCDWFTVGVDNIQSL